jgi:hypothetical protein
MTNCNGRSASEKQPARRLRLALEFLKTGVTMWMKWGSRPNSESHRPPSRTLTLRLRRLAGLCGFARFWPRAACRSAPGEIFVGDREYIMFNE